jgi:hypothetical protein
MRFDDLVSELGDIISTIGSANLAGQQPAIVMLWSGNRAVRDISRSASSNGL